VKSHGPSTLRAASPPSAPAAAEADRARDAYIFTPTPGMHDRKVVLDAVRTKVGAPGDLGVAWLKLSGDWAYFEGKAAAAPGGGKSPPSVNALLRRNPDGHWEAAEILVGPESDQRRADFRDRLDAQRARWKLPQGLFSDPGTP
jgi:hypothetical protein